MKTRFASFFALAAALALALPMQAGAASIQIDLKPQSGEVLNGSTTFLDLVGKYIGEGLVLGGAATLTFDPSKLQVLAVTVTAPTDIGIQQGTIDNTLGTVTGIGFASFVGVGNEFNFAKIQFKAIGTGDAQLSMADANDPIYVWVNEAVEVPTFINTTGTISVSAVPEPASLALMLGGLGVLGFASRRRTKS